MVVLVVLGIIVLAVLLIPARGSEKTEALGEEEKLEALCSRIEGVGECHVMVTYREGEVYAVAIVCSGADDPKVRAKLVELVTSVYGIGANRVSIQPLAPSSYLGAPYDYGKNAGERSFLI